MENELEYNFPSDLGISLMPPINYPNPSRLPAFLATFLCAVGDMATPGSPKHKAKLDAMASTVVGDATIFGKETDLMGLAVRLTYLGEKIRKLLEDELNDKGGILNPESAGLKITEKVSRYDYSNVPALQYYQSELDKVSAPIVAQIENVKGLAQTLAKKGNGDVIDFTDAETGEILRVTAAGVKVSKTIEIV